MEANLQYCSASIKSEAMPFKNLPGMQWTTPHDQNAAECQTARSLSPYFYSTTNSPCMCSKYMSVNSYCNHSSSLSTDYNSRKLRISEEKQPINESVSKGLKFGIERILTDTCSLENSTVSLVERENDHHKALATESASKGRRKNGTRSVFSHLQRNMLERHYQRREYVTKGERYHIALEVGITEEQVKIWFQNRRTKKKKSEMNKLYDKSDDVWL